MRREYVQRRMKYTTTDIIYYSISQLLGYLFFIISWIQLPIQKNWFYLITLFFGIIIIIVSNVIIFKLEDRT